MNFNDFKNSSNLLSHEQMKNVKGGEATPCCIAIRDKNKQWLGWSCGKTVTEAQWMYNSEFTWNSGNYVSGYCCASC